MEYEGTGTDTEGNILSRLRAWRPAGGGSLIQRTGVVSVLLAVIVGAVFSLLLLTIRDQQAATAEALRGRQVLLSADEMGLLIVDLETGLRGFIITGDEVFLQPWSSARARFPATSAEFQHLANGSGDGQAARARQIIRMTADYINYTIPLVRTARTDLPAARSAPVTAQGKRLVDRLRNQLAAFRNEERQLLTARQNAANADAARATAAASAGLGVSVLLVLLSGGYLARRVIRPVRDAARMADRVAGGDFTVRMPGTGPGEVGVLQRAFNTMAGSLQDSRDQLAASRARVVTAADESRRRIERDLHDGIQQRLIALTLKMRTAAGEISPEQAELREQWDQIAESLAEATEELRELSRGLHPAILAAGGLGPALRALVRRSGVPADLNVSVRERLPEQTEITAYYVVSEALTNVAKHARASRVQVDVERAGDSLRVLVRDNGRGGADPAGGTGLVGLSDRVEAADGRIEIVSPPGAGTSLRVTIPVPQWREYNGGGS